MQSSSRSLLADQASTMHMNAKLYHQDFDAWINSQVTLLRQGRVQDLNQEFLAEELEDMSRRQRGELVSRLIILIAHICLNGSINPNIAHRVGVVRFLSSV